MTSQLVIYRFKTGFYGRTELSAKFLNAMDYTFIFIQNKYCSLDKIILLSTGSESVHIIFLIKCFKKLNEDNFRICLQNCHLEKVEKVEFEWLGYKFTETIISPFESKLGVILAIAQTNTLKRWRIFLGSKYYIKNFIPLLAQLSHSLKPTQKKNAKIVRTEPYAKH